MNVAWSIRSHSCVLQAIHLKVIGAHPLAHDPRRHADHVRVPNAAALDEADDGHARRQLSFPRLNAENARIRALANASSTSTRGGRNRPTSDGLDQETVRGRARIVERRSRLAATVTAHFVGDERDSLAAADPRHVSTALCAPGSKSSSTGPNIIEINSSRRRCRDGFSGPPRTPGPDRRRTSRSRVRSN